MSDKYVYPVVFTGAEQVRLINLKGYTKIGYKSEIIAKHILEQNPAISSCSFVTGKDNIYLGDIKLKMRGYTRKDQARYVEVKTGTLYNIKVEPEAMEIIERYRGKEHLIKQFDRKAIQF